MIRQDANDDEQLPELIKLAPDAFFLADASGRYLEVNDAACELLGATRAEILGKSALDFVEPPDADELTRRLRALPGAGVARFEVTLRRPDGSSVPVEVHTRLLPGGQQQSIVRDISERWQRERELQADQRALQRLLQLCELHLSNQGDPVILDAVLAAAIATTEADCGSLQDFDPSTGELRLVAAHGFPTAGLGLWSRVAADQGARGTALLGQRARLIVEDLEASPGFASTQELEAHRQAGVRALQATPLFSRAGEPIGVISTYFRTARRPSASALRRLDLLAVHAADLLAHRRAEQKLRRAEALASGILAVSADAIISIDAQRRIVAWNPSAEQMFGYSRAEALGMPLEELLPPDRRAAHRDYVTRFVQESGLGRLMDHSSAHGRRKSGEEFPIEATISHLEVDGTRILTVAVRDISERRRREEEQRLLAELGGALGSVDRDETLPQIVRVATARLAEFALVFMLDEVTGQLRRAAAASRDSALASAAESVMGVPLQGALAQSVLQVVYEQKPLVVELNPEQYAALAPSPEQLRALTSVNPRSALIVPLVAVGKCFGALALARRAQRFEAPEVALAETMARRCALFLENARLYRAEQRAKRARDEVLQIVAHDLRNPLNAIGLQLQSLLRRRAEPERWQEAVERIRSSCTGMNQLIQDLLDVTRLEAGALSISLSLLEPERILQEVVETQQPLATAAGIALRRDAAVGLPRVRADHRRLIQVFQNLIDNAIKFTPAGGSITIGAVARDEAAEFRVADTGTGLSAEQLPHLFERFWQADRADRRGAGLGLAIVRGIIEAHGGRVRVESALGSGTTVLFSIPFAAAAEPMPGGRSAS